MRNLEAGFRVVDKNGTETGEIGRRSHTFCEVTTGLLGSGKLTFVPFGDVAKSQEYTTCLGITTNQIYRPNRDKPPARQRHESYGTLPHGAAVQSEPSPGTQPLLGTVEAGAPVMCVDGRDVGRVAVVFPDGFILERGAFTDRQTYRIPTSVVQSVARNRVFLTVECRDLEEFRRS